MASLFGRSVCAYQGIPYAQPPIDELRFRAPKAATNWEGILNATKKSKLCIGLQLNKNQPEMDEDCLYLNVYTPKVRALQWVQKNIAAFGGNPEKLLQNKSAVYAWNDNSDDIVTSPHILRMLDDQQMLDKHWAKILDFYLGEDTHMISNDSIVPLMQLYSDRVYNFGIYTSVVLHALSGHTDIFKYHFAFNGTSHYNKFPKYLRQFIGADHGDDLLYIFKLPMLETFPPGQPEIDIIMKMTKILSEFAKNGNPVIFNITWDPIGYIDKRNINLRYMDITDADPKSFDGLNLTMKQNLHKDRMEFWLTFPLSENSFLSNFTNSALSLVPLPIIITMTLFFLIVHHY
ncbi:hypothetical protein C0J52_05842 [Blattella germanica]|nr:hypothetical protein C0J52_05842 [Blattella germanica]